MIAEGIAASELHLPLDIIRCIGFAILVLMLTLFATMLVFSTIASLVRSFDRAFLSAVPSRHLCVAAHQVLAQRVAHGEHYLLHWFRNPLADAACVLMLSRCRLLRDAERAPQARSRLFATRGRSGGGALPS